MGSAKIAQTLPDEPFTVNFRVANQYRGTGIFDSNLAMQEGKLVRLPIKSVRVGPHKYPDLAASGMWHLVELETGGYSNEIIVDFSRTPSCGPPTLKNALGRESMSIHRIRLLGHCRNLRERVGLQLFHCTTGRLVECVGEEFKEIQGSRVPGAFSAPLEEHVRLRLAPMPLSGQVGSAGRG